MIDSTKKIGTVSYNGVPLEVDKNLTTKTITQNGIYNAMTDDGMDGYSEVEVDVSASANLGTKTIIADGTYNASDDSLDGYSSVTVNVPNYFQMYVTNYQGTEGLFMNTPLSDQQLAAMLNGVSVYNMDNMFTGSSIVVAPMFDTTNAYSANGVFSFCDSLTTVPAYDFSSVADMTDIFADCSSLEEINITNIKVDFDISASTNFTLSALQTILGNLADVASDGGSATLTMSPDSLALLSQNDIDAATAKGWTLA